MITLILRTAHAQHLVDAVTWVSDQLHIPRSKVTVETAVAYIVKHFEQGAYSGWDGWVEMRKADKS